MENEDKISFDLFARSVALLLEENTEKRSTSSQEGQSNREGMQEIGEENYN